MLIIAEGFTISHNCIVFNVLVESLLSILLKKW